MVRVKDGVRYYGRHPRYPWWVYVLIIVAVLAAAFLLMKG